MTPDSWKLIENLALRALELSPADRTEFLAKECVGEPDLLAEVEALVAADSEAGSFLEEPLLPQSLSPEELLGEPPGHLMSSSGSEVFQIRPEEASLPLASEPRLQRPTVEAGEKEARSRLFDPYRPMELIGRGSGGTVFRAVDRRDGSTVALKVLDWVAPSAIARFKLEFRSLSDLSHQNLVQLYELRRAGSSWFFTMELIAGTDLLTGLEGARKRGDWAPIRDAFRQLTRALMALHGAGKLHCDVKPSNVRITPEGKLVVLDFGLVNELATPSRSGPFGTPAYASPEQSRGLPLAPASDWFSVGVVLFEVLTGNRPFSASSAERSFELTLTEASTLEELGSLIPRDLAKLCRLLLAPTPEERPSGERIAKLLGLVEKVSGSWPIDWKSNSFVGRQDELARLQKGFEISRCGEATWFRIRGSSGIGKTSLAQAFLRLVQHESPEALILKGRCFVRESVPYAFFDSLIDGLCRHLEELEPESRDELLPPDAWALVELFPVLGRLLLGLRPTDGEEPQEAREKKQLALLAFRGLFERLRARTEMILFVDDLQWGDLESLELLEALFSVAEPPPLFLVTCERSEESESSPLLHALSASSSERRVVEREVALAPLSAVAAQKLAEKLLGETSKERAHDLVVEAGGIPFLLHELATFSTSSKPALPLEGHPPEKELLSELLRQRVSELSEPARRLLHVAAVAARPLPAVLVAVAAAADGGGRSEIAQLCAVQLLRIRRGNKAPGDQAHIEVYHDRLREALIAELDAEHRRRLHLRLASALEVTGTTDAELLAVHFGAAGNRRRQALYTAEAASNAARVLAFERAVRLYKEAMELSEKSERNSLRLPLAMALANAGHGLESADAYSQAATTAPPQEALNLRLRAAEQQLMSGHYDLGLETMRSVLSAMGVGLPSGRIEAFMTKLSSSLRLKLFKVSYSPRHPGQVSADLLREIDAYRSLTMGLANVRPILAMLCAERHLDLALKSREPRRLTRALALASGFAGTTPRGRARSGLLLKSARHLATALEQPALDGLNDLAEGLTRYLGGEGLRARELFDRAEKTLRGQAAVAWELDTTLFYQFRLLLFLGELKTVQRRLPMVLKECQVRSDLYAESSLRSEVACFLHLVADRPEESDAEIEKVERDWSHEGFHLQHYLCLGGRVENAIYRGLGGEAWELASSGWKALSRSALLRIDLVAMQAVNLRCRAALAAAAELPGGAERKQLTDSAGRDLARIARLRHPWAEPVWRLGCAACHHLAGREKQADTELLSATRLFEQHHLLLHAAAARWQRARFQVDGQTARVEAERWMLGQGAVNTARLAHLMAPGFA